LSIKQTELTRRLSGTPGFDEGYEQALRRQEFGERLRKYREALGLAQSELAVRAGLDQGDVSRFEAGKWGKRGLSFEKLEKILPILGLQLEHSIRPLPEQAVSKEMQQHLRALSSLL